MQRIHVKSGQIDGLLANHGASIRPLIATSNLQNSPRLRNGQVQDAIDSI